MSNPSQDMAPTVIRLGPEMTIAQAAEIHAQLLEAVAAQEHGLTLDLSGVSDFDSAGIQLLLATRASLHARERATQLLNPSPVVVAALKCYGLDAHLQDLRPAQH